MVKDMSEHRQLQSDYDAVLFDLDGTVWEGGTALPHARASIEALAQPVAYITNNASRGPAEVARLLSEMDIPTTAHQVLTSAQAAVTMAEDVAGKGCPVYVLGSQSFKDLAAEAGFQVVDSADDKPQVVLHGHNPDTGWAELSEAALAIAAGASYLASNLDTTLPAERGLMVGNGSMVAAVVSATGVQPQAAGKPQPTMFHQAAKKLHVHKPLAVGDRLNTDIAGAVAANMDVLHVLTGVSGEYALISAEPHERPTFIAEDLRGLFSEPGILRPHAQGGFTARFEGEDIVLGGGKDEATSVEALRTVLAVAWSGETAFQGSVRAEGHNAARCMESWR